MYDDPSEEARSKDYSTLLKVVFHKTIDYVYKCPNVDESSIQDEKDKFLDYEGRELVMTIAETLIERGRKEVLEQAEKERIALEKALEQAEKERKLALEQAEKERKLALEQAEKERKLALEQAEKEKLEVCKATQIKSAQKAFAKGLDFETVADLVDLPLDLLLSIKKEISASAN